MNVPELIRKKREGGVLAEDEIRHLITGFLSGSVEAYQISAFLMAVFFRGMEPSEAATLTRIMMKSGRIYDLSSVPGIKTDKHSTGGVGDKVSLVLAPLVAAAGAVDPMVSGRALGHTGGTLDKLDSIPGYRWDLTEEQFRRQLEKVGCAIIGQTDDFVPADKRLYAMRDVTATVESIPLICASILSKKAASGAEALVMDVKCGSGAFMASEEDALKLARQLVSIGTELGMKVSALLTQMNQPLGTTVGNALEIHEVLDVLEGKGPADTRDVTVELGAEMLVHANLAASHEEARGKLNGLLDDGSAMAKFQEWVAAQKGDPRIVENRALLADAPDRAGFDAPRAGVIQSMNTRAIGVACNVLGGGRVVSSDTIDHAVGLEVHLKVGAEVKAGERLVTLHHRGGKGLEEARKLLAEAIVIGEEPVKPLELVIARLDATTA
ncbi:MAG: pyrimidine-nucleoside phosphorylase [Candidatus Sumerlaeota bacterium]|nr:pyrimidine-nucleoside phosphorylase [Candidatus Sumerlaeota bacterium]